MRQAHANLSFETAPAARRATKVVHVDAPSEAAKLDRAASLCSEACWMVALQVRRLRSTEPEDHRFVFRYWADLQFLIIALGRLEKAARIATFEATVRNGIARFNKAVPALKTMRNVGEHVEDYAVDHPGRHDRRIGRRALQVGEWDGTAFTWLGQTLDVDVALSEAERLFAVVQSAGERHRKLALSGGKSHPIDD